MPESDVVCFHCSQPIGDPPQLNEMADGEPCPACRDRLLDELPPIFHAPLEAGGAIPVQETGTGEPEQASGLRLVEDDPDDEYPA
ncbi:MAG: hypothetical protein ACI8QZ_004216 [Chlamydiales bacterium]|jgi:hypothetical protein